ncbi:MAG: Ig-like domain-containing protein [Candidatus Saliniplasma sp.]
MIDSTDEDRKDLGVVSFALLGVLIILLSIFAAAYISRLDRINHENELRDDKISQLEVSIDNTLETIENKVKYIGVQSAFKAGAKDRANVSRIFQTRLNEYIGENAESQIWEHSGISVKIDDHDLNIGPQSASVEEITPEEDVDSINNDGPGSLKKRNTTFCYEVSGPINLTAYKESLELNKKSDIEITIDVPVPFMKNKMSTFDTNLRGDKSHIARITEYMLTTLAQYRTLAGYGMGPIGESSDSTKDTDDIITEEDVELAVNLALLFEIAYHYRSYDPEHVDSIVGNVSNIQRDRLEALISNYIVEERIDPGDIISLYHSYSYDGDVVEEEESVEIDISKIVAQAMNALVDQFVLKHLENMKVTPGLDVILKGVKSAEEVYESITDIIFGDDEDEINPQQVEIVKNWVRHIFISSGLMDTNLIRNYYGKFDRFQGNKALGYPSLPEDFEFNDEFIYFSRLEGEDHAWYEFICDHGDLHRKKNDTCDEIIELDKDGEGNPIEVRCGAEEKKTKHDFREGIVDFKVENGPVSFEPVNILDGNDKLWQEFYDEHFKGSVDEDPNEVSDAVKQIIYEFIERLVKNTKIKSIIKQYNNIEVNPTDEISFMRKIQQNVDEAIHDVIDHFRRNPDEIADILKTKLHQEGDPKVQNLIGFLNENYDELVHDWRVKSRTAEKTAYRLSDPTSPYLDITGEEYYMYIEDMNEQCDFSWADNRTIRKDEASHVIQDGNVFGKKTLDSLYDAVHEETDELYQEIKKREIHISGSDENVSEEDGLIIQALNHYQYNISYESENKTYSTRSGNAYSWIEEISPNPATQNQHKVFFCGNTSLNYTQVEWKSDLDGHLSNDIQFNRSARFMTSGEHEITFKVLDENGTIYEDKERLFINIPPEAVIENITPAPATEFQDVAFTESSLDSDGVITDMVWDFGDGTQVEGGDVNHTYTTPGLYNVNLTVWDDKGGFDTVHEDILVDDAPSVIDILPDTDDRWDTYNNITVKFSESVDPESLEYSIEPYVEFDEVWDDNRTLILTPIDPYPRDTNFYFSIDDVEDVDNGTASSMLEPATIDWRTKKHGEIIDIHPDDMNAIDVQRSIVLILDESAAIRDFDRFIDQDWNWTYSWENDNTHLVLDHDVFPSGQELELTFDLRELKAEYDNSPFRKDGSSSFTLVFNTKSKHNPNLISITPQNGTMGVSLDEEIRLNFDKSINISSFELILNPDAGNLSYNWNDNNDSVSVTHDGFLPYQDYRIFIEAECREGLPLHVSESIETSNPFTFRTEDTSNPDVLFTSPKDGTEHYLSNSPIVIQFDKRMNQEDLHFSCYPNPGDWVSRWNEDGTILILNHAGFEPGREITFTLEEASDIRGNPLLEEVEIHFQISDNGEHIEGNLFQKKLWSFIGGGPFGDSLFDITEAFMRETTSNMILSAEMTNLEYRVPLTTQNNFNYSPPGTNSSRELELMLDLQPGYLQMEDILELSDPTGHHFTEVTTISSRPFKTKWEIEIPSIEIFLDAKRRTPYVIEEDESSFLSLNKTYEIGFSISVSVASGWALEDVEYTRDDIDLSSILDFLNKVWDMLKKPISYLLDGLYKILELFDNIVNRLKEHAASLIEYLGEMIKSLVSTTLKNLAETILDNRESLKDFTETLSLLGINMGIDVYEDGHPKELPNTDSEKLVFLKLDIDGSAFGTTLDLNLYVLENNVVATGNLSSDRMNILWQIDPFADVDELSRVYDSWFQSQGKFGREGDGAILDLVIPEIEKAEDPEEENYEYSAEKVIPALSAVSIPIGPVVVSNFDIGLKIKYIDVTNVSSELIKGTLNNVFWDTVDHMRDSNFNIDYIVDFVRTFGELLLEELVRFLRSVLDSIELFFSCTVNQVEIALAFGLSSADGVIDFIQWIGAQVRHLLQSIVDRKPNCKVDSLPVSILEETELSIKVGMPEASSASFSVNIPAIASIIGRDIGQWRIKFAVELATGMKLVDGQLMEW